MKKIFIFLLLAIITVSCKCEETVTVYTLTDQEKTIVPYELNDAIKWIDHNSVINNGIVSEVVNRYNYDYEDCKTINYNIGVYSIQFDNFKYSIALDKRSTNETDFIIQEYVNNDIRNSFVKQQYITLDDFTTIEFNGETYENAVLLKQKGSDSTPFGHLVFSKTNGIEFILFEDGTWYKRVE